MGPGLLWGFGPTRYRQPSPRLSSLGAGMVCSSGLHGSLPLHSVLPPTLGSPLPQSVGSWVGGVSSGSARGPPLLVRGHGVEGILCVRTVCGPLPAAPNSCPHSQARVSLRPFLRLSPAEERCDRGQNRESCSPGGGGAQLTTASLGLKGHHPRWGPRPPSHRTRPQAAESAACSPTRLVSCPCWGLSSSGGNLRLC